VSLINRRPAAVSSLQRCFARWGSGSSGSDGSSFVGQCVLQHCVARCGGIVWEHFHCVQVLPHRGSTRTVMWEYSHSVGIHASVEVLPLCVGAPSECASTPTSWEYSHIDVGIIPELEYSHIVEVLPQCGSTFRASAASAATEAATSTSTKASALHYGCAVMVVH
jgi:hypothetical protein